MKLDIDALISGCSDESFEDGIRIDTELEPLAGPRGPVKPAIYEGGRYQLDRRWASSQDHEPTEVIVIDNVPSQANRLEDALRRQRSSVGIPELVLDLSECGSLPAHLPKQLSSLQFPHRNADAYLRDAQHNGEDFPKTNIGKSILYATPWACGPLMAWFPQALLYGFWQSHLGKKGTQTKHARAWVSEIIGWNPAATDKKAMGLKGDPLNLSIEEKVSFDADNQTQWSLGKEAKVKGGKNDKLSEIGHGQAIFMKESDAAPAAVSFERVIQRATVSFAHLRRISLGAGEHGNADAAARALLVAMGLHAHRLAFGRGFALRSGAELRPRRSEITWLGSDADIALPIDAWETTGELLRSAKESARSEGVPLDGWEKNPLLLKPKKNLANAILKTWPQVSE